MDQGEQQGVPQVQEAVEQQDGAGARPVVHRVEAAEEVDHVQPAPRQRQVAEPDRQQHQRLPRAPNVGVVQQGQQAPARAAHVHEQQNLQNSPEGHAERRKEGWFCAK